jgi:hypothetical protein
MGFIHRSLAREWKLRLNPLSTVLHSKGFNGTYLKGGHITHTTKLTLRHYNHKETIQLMVTDIGNHSIILGQSWMFKHRVGIDYDHERLQFNAARCRTRCLVHLNSKPKPSTTIEHRPLPSRSRTRSPKPTLLIRHRHNQLLPKMYRQLREPTPESEPEPELSQNTASSSDLSPDEEPELVSDAELNIYCIGAAPFVRIAKKPDHEIFAVSIADIDKALAPKVYTDPATKVPEEYHDLLEVFSREKSDRLPDRRPYDHKIKVEEGKQPGFGPLYGMSQNELKVLRKYLDDNLSKGFI